MSGYQPDPPFQLYWSDEPPPAYQAEYRRADYWPENPVKDYWPEEPVVDEKAAPPSSIWTTPVYAPLPVRRVAPLPSQPAVGTHKPMLRLVPSVSPTVEVKPKAAPAPEQKIVDRRVLLIEARQAVEMFLEAGDEDGYTRADLAPYFSDMEASVKKAGTKLRGNLLQRVSRWIRPDES